MFRRRPAVQIKTDEQIGLMREAGLVVADALEAVAAAVAPGVTGRQLDAIAEDVIRSAGAVPSFLGYHGFPASICVSVDNAIVHGIPNNTPLHEGALLSVDCGAVLAGWHGDAAVSVPVGEIGQGAQDLSEVTRSALWHGVAHARPGGRLSDIGAAVERTVRAAAHDYGIVREYVGHGIGSQMHMPPDVPNVGPAGRGIDLVPGVVLAVEPMVTLGAPDNVTLPDGWTVVTMDGSLAAHWEHTVAVTSTGPWVLTARDGGRAELGLLGVQVSRMAG
ncbi:MAG TPA: type I methionyl aminopeptidase [Actinomycetota bacterium]|nr:type I methionyl aminopeptidase [Actinomycetota bacterium]